MSPSCSATSPRRLLGIVVFPVSQVSFPAGAQRRGRESKALRVMMDSFPGLRPPGMTPSHVMAVPGLDPGISPGHPDAEKHRASPIEITGTRPVMTWGVLFPLHRYAFRYIATNASAPADSNAISKVTSPAWSPRYSRLVIWNGPSMRPKSGNDDLIGEDVAVEEDLAHARVRGFVLEHAGAGDRRRGARRCRPKARASARRIPHGSRRRSRH